MEVLIKDGEECRFATIRELVDQMLIEVSGRVNGARDAAAEADVEIDEALGVAGKVDEMRAKLEELEVRVQRLEREAAP